MQLPAFIIPLVGNPGNNNAATNVLNGQSIVIPQNATVRFPMTIFLGAPSTATMISDLGNIVTAEMVLRGASANSSDPAAGALLFDQVIPAASLNAALTFAQFQTGTAGHAIFSMSSADTNRAPGNYYLSFGVTTTNAGNVPLGFSANVTIKDYGIFGGGIPSSPTGISYTEQQSDARYAMAAAVPIYRPDLTGAAGGGAATDLSSVETSTLPLYSSVILREYASSPGAGVTGWVLELTTDAVDNARVCPAQSAVVFTPSRVWRNRF